MSRSDGAHVVSLATVAGCCIALAACGSTGQPSGTATAAANSAPAHVTRDVAFSDCMRTHGVPNFPDPSSGGDLHLPSGLDQQSPAFRSAQKACVRYLPNKGAPPATPARERSAAVAFAKCMRSHGVPQFPDPAFTSPRGAARVLVLHEMVYAISPSLDPKSPDFQQAAGACGLRNL